jgi:hypothetical protein
MSEFFVKNCKLQQVGGCAHTLPKFGSLRCKTQVPCPAVQQCQHKWSAVRGLFHIFRTIYQFRREVVSWGSRRGVAASFAAATVTNCDNLELSARDGREAARGCKKTAGVRLAPASCGLLLWFRWHNMQHTVVKIASHLSDDLLDAACAHAAKEAAARGLPFAESCEYNKVCQCANHAVQPLVGVSPHIVFLKIPIHDALRSALNPSAPPLTALEIGSGTAQHALHLLGAFNHDSGPKISKFSPNPPKSLILSSRLRHASAPDGSSVKCPVMTPTLPSARCMPRVKSMLREWPPPQAPNE